MNAPIKHRKEARACNALATLGLVVIALATAAAVCYSAVVDKNAAAQTLLATLATGALSALIVLSGGRNRE